MDNTISTNVEIRQDVKRKLVGKNWTIIGMLAVIAIISALLSQIVGMIFGINTAQNEIISNAQNTEQITEAINALRQTPKYRIYSLINSIMELLIYPASVGVSFYCLKIIREEKDDAPFDNLLAPYRKKRTFLMIIGTTVVKYVIVAIGFCLLIVPGIILSIDFSNTVYLIKDEPELSLKEYFAKSRELVKGHRGQIFVMWLYYFILMLLSSFLLFIPLFWIVPQMSMTAAKIYDELRIAKECPVEPQKPDIDETVEEPIVFTDF